MPKKFKGENSKAVEARARKDAAKAAEQEKKKQAEEDAFWQDDDKHVARKQQRKEDKEKKRQDQLERKKELQRLADEEMSGLKSAKASTPATKVTRAQVQANLDRLEAEAIAAAKKEDLPLDEKPIEENLNRLVIEGDEARSIEEAISVLGKGEPEVDRHPEKRMKAAYLEYEERNLPILKAENPTMRLSQLKQMLKKDWMKSPDNPLNQSMAATHNQKR